MFSEYAAPLEQRKRPSWPIVFALFKSMSFNNCAQILSLWGDSPRRSEVSPIHTPPHFVMYIYTSYTHRQQGHCGERCQYVFLLAKTSRENSRNEVLVRLLEEVRSIMNVNHHTSQHQGRIRRNETSWWYRPFGNVWEDTGVTKDMPPITNLLVSPSHSSGIWYLVRDT